MDFQTIVNLVIGAAIGLALLRWVLSISQITKLLTQQRDLLMILVEQTKKRDPGMSPSVLFESSDDEVLNSLRATKLQDLKKKWEAGIITEADYREEASKI
jgi:hypothetical protein